jgi:hypothetical protein
MFENSGLTSSLNRVRGTLESSLKNNYGKEDQQLVDNILKVHGLHKDDFDFINNLEKLISSNLSDAGIDTNANKNEQTMTGMLVETTSPVNKLVGYRYLYRKLKDMYGKEEANRLLGELYDYSLAISDSSKILLAYCFSVDASKLVLDGRPFGQLHSAPPKRISSYIASLNETIHQLSNHLAGACLYKDQKIIIRNDKTGNIYSLPIKSFIDTFTLTNKFDCGGLWEYEPVSSFSVLENRGNFTPINKVMRRKYTGSIYKITTKSGKVVCTSSDHIFKVLYKGRDIEVKAKDIKQYDTVYNTQIGTKIVNIESQEYKDGQFIGILSGDGNITEKYQIRVAINYKQTFISDFLDSYLGVNKGTLNDGHGCYDYKIYNKDFIDKVKEKFIGNTLYTKNINVKSYSLDFLLGFLDGILVTDGFFNNSIGISLCNKGLIDSIKSILEMVGIYNYTYSEYMDNKDNKSILYRLSIPLFTRKYLSLMNTKIYQTNLSRKTKWVGIQDEEVSYFGKYAFSHSQGIRCSNPIKTYKERERLLYPSSNTDVIVSVDILPNDDDYVYELETESHWYSAGGILTHNCAIGSFFLDVAHVGIFREKITLEDLKTNEKTRKYIENCFQNFVHSVNHLSRNAVECVTEDTEVLTPQGFKKYNELFVGDDIYTWKDSELRVQKVHRVNVSKYSGDMHLYEGRDYSQQVTPNHRVLRKKFNKKEYELIESSKIIKDKTSITFPVACNRYSKEDYPILDSKLKLIAVIACDGCLSGNKISITKSPNREYNDTYVKKLLEENNIEFSVSSIERSFGCAEDRFINKKYTVSVFSILGEGKKELLNIFNNTKEELPSFLSELSRRQAKLFIDTWSHFDGQVEGNNYNKTCLQVDNDIIADQVQHIAFIAGFSSHKRYECLSNKNPTLYVKLYTRSDKNGSGKVVNYTGVVWCPTTEDGIVVYRKSGRVFISGNSPFSNISIFDSVKLRTLLSSENMGWYFQDVELEYVVEYIMELQKIFMDFFDKGDALSGGKPFRFPVCFPGNESVIINNKLTTFKGAFSSFSYGWTRGINGMYTTKDFNEVKITSVYRGTSKEFIDIVGLSGKVIRVTPEHKFPLSNGLFKCAKDLVKGDEIPLSLSCSIPVKEELVVSDYVNDLSVLGYKLRYNKHTENLLNTLGYTLCNNTIPFNHKRSMPYNLLKELTDNDILCKPDEELVKTRESKQKGAINNIIPFDFSFGYFLGLYYSEGHNSNGELGLSFNKKETDLITFSKNFLDSIGIHHTQERPSLISNGTQLCFYSRTLGNLLDTIVGNGCENKEFNLDLVYTPDVFKWGIYCGLIEGDGHVNRYIHFTTVSKRGAESIQYLVNSIGISSKIRVIPPRKHPFFKKCSESYYISFNKPLTLSLLSRFEVCSGKFKNGEFLKYYSDKELKLREVFKITGIIPIVLDKQEDVYNMEVESEDHIYTLPCGVKTSNCTINCSKKTNGDIKLQDLEFVKMISKHDIFRYNILVSEGSKVASCCRLVSNSEMFELGGQSNSFGGSGLSLGSHRVVVINFNRIALECSSYSDFLTRLEKRVDDTAKILVAHRSLIQDTVKSGLQPFISNHWLRLDRMFSTIGIIGNTEAKLTLEKRFVHYDGDIMADMLSLLDKKAKEATTATSKPFNIEQIPGETMAVRLCNVDKMIYGTESVPFELYSNQFIPLWENASIWDRMDTDGKYNKLITGGGIVHFNLGEKTTSTQNMRLINYAAESGCEHFALNSVYSECDNAHVNFGNLEVCPECGNHIIEKYTRVIGFFTPVSSWNKTRREWEFPKRSFTPVD